MFHSESGEIQVQIDRVYYPVQTLGYGNRVGIWTIGCIHHCENCSNPELWEFDSSKDISIDKIISCVRQAKEVDGVTITGGDPFEQAEELYRLVKALKNLGIKDILVYSGYTIDELRIKGQIERAILKEIGILVDGQYVDSLNDNKSFRGSSNQVIHVLNEELTDRYLGADDWVRKTQVVINQNQIQAIGLPIK